MVRKRNEGRGRRLGATQGGRKPAAAESHASKLEKENYLVSKVAELEKFSTFSTAVEFETL